MSLQKGTQVCWTCSDLGGWLLERWTCASRCLLLHTIKITAFHAVVQCDNVLLWAFICLNLAVKRRALLELYAQVTIIRKSHHFQKKSLTWKPTTDLVSHNSVMIEIPGYLFCIFVMDCWGRRPILSFCQVVINTLTRRWLFSVWQFSCYRLYLALPASSVASCKDRLIQTSRICRWAFASFQNPLFKGVEWKKLTPQISGIPLPLGQVWGFSLLLHRLSLHCRALSYNCEVVVS